MLKRLRLENFRGFDDHTIELAPVTIAVGRNNAGKSTFVEALRLISLVVTHCRSRMLYNLPRTWTISRTARRVTPSLQNLEINLDSVFHRYGEPPAIITATFASGATIGVNVWADTIEASIRASRQNDLTYVSILPQVAPVSKDERVLGADYVKSAMSSALAPLHFRNQLLVLRELFPSFKQAAESSWANLRVEPLERIPDAGKPDRLSLMIRDGDFTAEVGWMGHGLQMWLQTMWFLTRAKNHETVILDEPDVYMHADLQRKLIRFLKRSHKQVVVTTHSSEIMAEVEPDEILIVNKAETRSRYAASIPIAQEMLFRLGSVHNLQLARFSAGKRFVLVEGDDISVLKRFQNTLAPTSDLPLDTISMPVEGWGGWNYAIGSSMLLQNAAGQGIVSYCLLDSDYHTAAQIRRRRKEAKHRHIQLHIWSKKEIENYVLQPRTITRLISKGMQNDTAPSQTAVADEIDRIAEELRPTVLKSIASEIQKGTKGLELSTAVDRAEKIVAAKWKNRSGRWGIIPGKQAVSRLSDWSQNRYGVSLNATKIAREMEVEEIDKEMATVLAAIERNAPLPA
jgi:hypothetical protein